MPHADQDSWGGTKLKINKQFTGALGEDFVSSELQRRGWQILDRNYRIRGSEIDIVACREHKLLFAEVKTRAQDSQLIHKEIDLGIKRKKTALLRGILTFLNQSPTLTKGQTRSWDSILNYTIVVEYNPQNEHWKIVAAIPLDLYDQIKDQKFSDTHSSSARHSD
jgi:Holliday junction resolvase-like predicted endonuclease